jgi:hypothetical protein
MSFEATSAVFAHSKATGNRLTVLLAIAWHYPKDAGEGCFPSVDRLARFTNISPRTVYRAIHDLELDGELEVFRHDGESSGASHPNRYYITVDCDLEYCSGYPKHNPLPVDKSPITVDNFISIGDKSGINR